MTSIQQKLLDSWGEISLNFLIASVLFGYGFYITSDVFLSYSFPKQLMLSLGLGFPGTALTFGLYSGIDKIRGKTPIRYLKASRFLIFYSMLFFSMMVWTTMSPPLN